MDDTLHIIMARYDGESPLTPQSPVALSRLTTSSPTFNLIRIMLYEKHRAQTHGAAESGMVTNPLVPIRVGARYQRNTIPISVAPPDLGTAPNRIDTMLAGS